METNNKLIVKFLGYNTYESNHVRTKPKKVRRSFTESKIEMSNYFMKWHITNIYNRISNTLYGGKHLGVNIFR